jgi:predicted transglutaminase-like cysteine proteinase
MIRALALVVAAALAAAPVSNQADPPKQASIMVVSDPISEAKFPRETAETIDDLQAINNLVNSTMIEKSDMEQYGVEDLWIMAPASKTGDCEDIALTKLFILGNITSGPFKDYSLVSRTKIRTVFLKDLKTNEVYDGHAILEVLLPQGTVAFLDNRNEHLMTRKELEAQGYVFFDWN